MCGGVDVWMWVPRDGRTDLVGILGADHGNGHVGLDFAQDHAVLKQENIHVGAPGELVGEKVLEGALCFGIA
jgi:hypothetical protein